MQKQGGAKAPNRRGASEIKRKYNVEQKVLGAGSFGKVFLAKSIADSDFVVAIKAIQKKKMKEDIGQIREEISILQALDHPNIIRYHETFENDNYMYLVMEYCPGGELFDVISRKAQSEGSFNESEAASIMECLLKAIAHCHASKVAHRDIKPENVMIGKEGEIKLIDFGLSRQRKKKGVPMETIVGTPYYIAPEVLEGAM